MLKYFQYPILMIWWMIVYHKIFLHVMMKLTLMKLKQNQLYRDSLETIENNKSNNYISHSYYMAI